MRPVKLSAGEGAGLGPASSLVLTDCWRTACSMSCDGLGGASDGGGGAAAAVVVGSAVAVLQLSKSSADDGLLVSMPAASQSREHR